MCLAYLALLLCLVRDTSLSQIPYPILLVYKELFLEIVYFLQKGTLLQYPGLSCDGLYLKHTGTPQNRAPGHEYTLKGFECQYLCGNYNGMNEWISIARGLSLPYTHYLYIEGCSSIQEMLSHRNTAAKLLCKLFCTIILRVLQSKTNNQSNNYVIYYDLDQLATELIFLLQ